MTTMDNVIVIESEDSENSVIEVEVPKKATPPLIFIEDEEIILNLQPKNEKSILAKDFIKNDQKLSTMARNPMAVGSSCTLNSPNHWTSDMIKFYDDDWGDEENFTVEKLQEKMDKRPSLWDVSRKNKSRRNIKKNHIKCWNCGQRGHHSSICPDPPRVTKCHMCGTEGHAEYFCPNSKCLNCGSHSREFVNCCYKCRNQRTETCSRCQLVGHNYINCTDHWRLFHMTTGTTSVRVPDKNINKSDKDMWCCNCGRRGHNQIWCGRRKNSDGFMNSFPFVISYERSFSYSQSRSKSNDISWKRNKINKGSKDRVDKREKILRINPHNKAIWKNRLEIKNRLKKLKKNKKNKKKQNAKQKFFDGLLI